MTYRYLLSRLFTRIYDFDYRRTSRYCDYGRWADMSAVFVPCFDPMNASDLPPIGLDVYFNGSSAVEGCVTCSISAAQRATRWRYGELNDSVAEVRGLV